MSSDLVTIVGSDGLEHRVPAERADQFFNADDGSPLSDADYDETKRRTAELEALGPDAVTWEPLEEPAP